MQALLSLFRIKLPRAVWALGFVSLFMDVSSELIHSLLPIFVTVTLGASATALGLLEGSAEALAMMTKLVSGFLSDKIGKRKELALFGYGLAALSKPLFPLASSFSLVFTARSLDRIGKGIRGAPRDALVGAWAPPELRGAAYGLRQSLDTVGAFLGPALALIFMLLFKDNIPAVLWVAILPAFLSVATLYFGVAEPPETEPAKPKEKIILRKLAAAGAPYWKVLIMGCVLTLARFSEAFLILRAQASGIAEAWLPAVMIVMSLVFALAAYPVGALSDRLGRRGLLTAGICFLIAADLTLAFAKTPLLVFCGVALWGLHMGFSEGLLSAMVTDTTPPDVRGTAFGLFNFASGLCLLFASVLAGALWDSLGPTAPFLAGAAFAGLALCGIVFMRSRPEEK